MILEPARAGAYSVVVFERPRLLFARLDMEGGVPVPPNDAVDRLSAEYNALRSDLEPRIAANIERADELASAFRGHFARASDEWEAGDRAAAKYWSTLGHQAKDECKALNAETSAMKAALSTKRDELTAGRRAQGKSFGRRTPGGTQQVHGTTRLRGFDGAHGWTSTGAKTFLEHLPVAPFEDIDSITYVAETGANGTVGLTQHLTDRSRKVSILLYRNPLALDSEQSVNDTAWTLVHEYAHVVFDRRLAAGARLRWGLLSNRTISDGGPWITHYASEGLRDDFSECFAAYVLARDRLAEVAPEKYAFIHEVMTGL